jgi:hypothetical protein
MTRSSSESTRGRVYRTRCPSITRGFSRKRHDASATKNVKASATTVTANSRVLASRGCERRTAPCISPSSGKWKVETVGEHTSPLQRSRS